MSPVFNASTAHARKDGQLSDRRERDGRDALDAHAGRHGPVRTESWADDRARCRARTSRRCYLSAEVANRAHLIERNVRAGIHVACCSLTAATRRGRVPRRRARARFDYAVDVHHPTRVVIVCDTDRD